jgi:hypothetical protein
MIIMTTRQFLLRAALVALSLSTLLGVGAMWAQANHLIP